MVLNCFLFVVVLVFVLFMLVIIFSVIVVFVMVCVIGLGVFCVKEIGMMLLWFSSFIVGLMFIILLVEEGYMMELLVFVFSVIM